MSEFLKDVAEVAGAAETVASPATATTGETPATAVTSPEDMMARLAKIEAFVALWEPRLNSIMVLVGKL